MFEHAVTRRIPGPQDAAWRAISDVERWPEWLPTVTSVERLDPGPLGVGSRVRVRQPKLRPALLTVTSWEPGRAFSWGTRQPGLRFTADHELRPDGDGCVVTLRVRFEGPASPLVRWLYGRLVRDYVRREAEALEERVRPRPSGI